MISIEIRGDYTSFQKDMARVRAIAREDAKAISDAMNNSISMNAAATQMTALIRNFNVAARSAQGLKADTSAAMDAVRKMGEAAGVSGRQFEKMAQQSMKVMNARQLENSMRNLQKSTGASAWEMVKLRSSIGDNVGAIKTLGRAAADSFRSIANLRNALLVGAAGYGLGESARTAMQFDTYQRSFNAISGGPEGGADQMRFVRQEAERLGQDIFSLADSYRGLSAAAMSSGLTLEQVRDVFSSVGEASTTLGLTSDQTKYALYALQQMMSKGVVSMEELRRQLGDSLPGAFSAAARAMGVTEAELTKMVESGELVSRDFLPKFATELRQTFGGGFEEAAQSAARQITRMSNAWAEAKGTFGAGFLDEVAQGSTGLTATLERNNQNIKMAGELVGAFVSFLGAAISKTTEFTQLSALGWIGIAESALASYEAVKKAANPFDGVSPAQALAGFQSELRGIWENVAGLGNEISGNLNVAVDSASAGMNTAANAADNAADATWSATDAYKDLVAAMSLIGSMGASIGQSMESDMKILTDFTKQARSAAIAAKDQAKANADLALMSLDSQRQKFIDNGDFEAALELNIQLERQVSLLREIERGEIGIETVRKGRGRKGGLSDAEKEARAAEKAHKEMVHNLQEQLQFYDELRSVMPAAGEQYANIRNQLLDLEAAQLSSIGVTEEHIAAWRQWQELREGTDAMSGFTVAIHDYMDGLTAASQAQSAFQVFTSGTETAFVSMITGAKSARDAFADLGEMIVNELARIAVQMLILKPLMSGLGGLFGGFFGFADGGVFSGNALSRQGFDVPFAKGGVPNARGLHSYVNQVVSRPTLFPFAGGTGLMGEAGPEAIMPLTRTSGGKLGVSVADGYVPQQQRPIKVTIENNGTPQTYQVKYTTPDEVRMIANDIVQQKAPSVVAGNMNQPNGVMAKSMSSNYVNQRKRSG